MTQSQTLASRERHGTLPTSEVLSQLPSRELPQRLRRATTLAKPDPWLMMLSQYFHATNMPLIPQPHQTEFGKTMYSVVLDETTQQKQLKFTALPYSGEKTPLWIVTPIDKKNPDIEKLSAVITADGNVYKVNTMLAHYFGPTSLRYREKKLSQRESAFFREDLQQMLAKSVLVAANYQHRWTEETQWPIQKELPEIARIIGSPPLKRQRDFPWQHLPYKFARLRETLQERTANLLPLTRLAVSMRIRDIQTKIQSTANKIYVPNLLERKQIHVLDLYNNGTQHYGYMVLDGKMFFPGKRDQITIYLHNRNKDKLPIQLTIRRDGTYSLKGKLSEAMGYLRLHNMQQIVKQFHALTRQAIPDKDHQDPRTNAALRRMMIVFQEYQEAHEKQGQHTHQFSQTHVNTGNTATWTINPKILFARLFTKSSTPPLLVLSYSGGETGIFQGLGNAIDRLKLQWLSKNTNSSLSFPLVESMQLAQEVAIGKQQYLFDGKVVRVPHVSFSKHEKQYRQTLQEKRTGFILHNNKQEAIGGIEMNGDNITLIISQGNQGSFRINLSQAPYDTQQLDYPGYHVERTAKGQSRVQPVTIPTIILFEYLYQFAHAFKPSSHETETTEKHAHRLIAQSIGKMLSDYALPKLLLYANKPMIGRKLQPPTVSTEQYEGFFLSGKHGRSERPVFILYQDNGITTLITPFGNAVVKGREIRWEGEHFKFLVTDQYARKVIFDLVHHYSKTSPNASTPPRKPSAAWMR